MNILKFGGTSVKSAEAMRQVLNCIKTRSNHDCLILLSAVSGTTDSLIKTAKYSIEDLEISFQVIDGIKTNHYKIVRDLDFVDDSEIYQKLDVLFIDLIQKVSAFNYLGELTLRNIDSIIAIGEMLSTTIFHYFCRQNDFQTILIDSKDYIKTDSQFTNASVDFEYSLNIIKNNTRLFNSGNVIIAQGFIGSDAAGRTTTLGRGGSDYSASVYASLLKSVGIDINEIQIWTDVDGVLTSDPRIVNNAFTISEMSSFEIRTLSYLGAKVLHPNTIKPAFASDIPVRVLNTFLPECDGTLIIDNLSNKLPQVHSLIKLENYYELTINAPHDKSSWDLMQKVLQIADSADCHPIASSISEESAILYFKDNSEVFSESSISKYIEIKRTSVIAVIGNNPADYINSIYDIFKNFELSFISIIGSAVYFKSKSEINNEIFNRLHNEIFLQNNI